MKYQKNKPPYEFMHLQKYPIIKSCYLNLLDQNSLNREGIYWPVRFQNIFKPLDCTQSSNDPITLTYATNLLHIYGQINCTTYLHKAKPIRKTFISPKSSRL